MRLRIAAVALFISHLPSPISAQARSDPIRARRTELERIRDERAGLEREMAALRSTVHDLDAEVRNLRARASATARLVSTLDLQLVAVHGEINLATTNVKQAETELAGKRVVLRKRLVDIYKRGPMFAAQAMLSASSFGELVARYKYLHLLALRDRSLVDRVEALRAQIAGERDRLMILQRNLLENREDRRLESSRLKALEQAQRQQLSAARSRAQITGARLTRLKQTEKQLMDYIASLETERRRAAAATPSFSRATSSIKTTDYGKLDWPVDGGLLYTFGREVQANNTSISWNGVGIRANSGTSVKAVAAGRVARVSQLGTYGLTVIVEHGGGDYSIYGSLQRADVKDGQVVAKAQVIGATGVSDPELPAHLHFEIRHGAKGEAIDPTRWLRRK